jgi:hypothetical protein
MSHRREYPNEVRGSGDMREANRFTLYDTGTDDERAFERGTFDTLAHAQQQTGRFRAWQIMRAGSVVDAGTQAVPKCKCGCDVASHAYDGDLECLTMRCPCVGYEAA